MRGVLIPAIKLYSFGSFGGLPSPHFESVSFIVTISQGRVATILYIKATVVFVCLSVRALPGPLFFFFYGFCFL
jgi:hypothetical protein